MKWNENELKRNEVKWMNWNEGIAMNDLKWMSWNEWIEMSELKSMNWNERIQNGNEGTETKELQWMTWNEWVEMNELKWVSWNQWIEMNELKMEMKELKRMNLNEWLAKSGPPPSVFVFYVKSSSRYGLVRLLPTSWSKSDPSPTVFAIFMWTLTLATVSCTFCRPHLPKVLRARHSLVHLLPTSSSENAPSPTVFYNIYVKSNSRYSPVHFLSETFPNRPDQTRKQRPSFGDHGSHFTRKNTGFRARECFQAWIHAFPISYTSQLLDDDDDMVAMMMRFTWWLRWWCGCHDGEKASLDNRP